MKKHHDKGGKQSNTYPPNADDIKARRKTVGKLLAGAGVVGSIKHWGKPVIETVILPAHAETTRDSPPSPSPPPPS